MLTDEQIARYRELIGPYLASVPESKQLHSALDELCVAAHHANLLEDANRKIGRQLLEHSEALANLKG